MAQYPLPAEGFTYAQLAELMIGVSPTVVTQAPSGGIVPYSGVVPVFAGIQLPSQVTPYVSYSRTKTDPVTRPLKGGTQERATILVEVMADVMKDQFDLIYKAIRNEFDGASDLDNVEATQFLDFRWATVEVKTPKSDRMVIRGQMYFWLWVR
jgi:hypothetical protein